MTMMPCAERMPAAARLRSCRRAPRRRGRRARCRPARPAPASAARSGDWLSRRALDFDLDAPVGREALDQRVAVLLVRAGLDRRGLAEAEGLHLRGVNALR